MRKFIGTVLVTVMAAALIAGCGKKEEKAPAEDMTTASSPLLTEDTTGDTKPEISVGESKTASEEDFIFEELESGGVRIEDYRGEATDVTVPDTLGGKPVEEIFYMGGSLTSVVLPDSVKVICNKAFNNDWDLTKVQLGSGVEIIGSNAFINTNVTEINFPEGLKEIKADAFLGADIEEITLPSTLEVLGMGAFAQNDFKSVTVPGSVKEIGAQCFARCENLEEVILEEGVEKINDGAFGYCTNLKKMVLPASVTEIGGIFTQELPELRFYTPAGSYADECFKKWGPEYVINE